MRKQLRARRRIQADKARKEARFRHSYDEVFSYRHFTASYQKCLKGVSWKPSVQRYMLGCVRQTLSGYRSLKERRLPPTMYRGNVVIRERGKQRTITPIHIRDRVIQKVLCDNLLTPVLAPHLIYDNGASMAGKGTSFARRRMDEHLRRAIREYGPDFYVLRYDFKSYFDSIPHATCRRVLEKHIPDRQLVEIAMDTIKAPYLQKARKDQAELARLDADQGRGICLGSQVSQLMALAVPNEIDHYVKDRRRFRYYMRYMDDGVAFARTKEELESLLSELVGIADGLGLAFNPRKTRIIRSRDGFIFLKTRYRITQTGKIIKRLSRDAIIRMRRKLVRYRGLVDAGRMDLEDVRMSLQSWDARARLCMAYRTRGRMRQKARELFGHDLASGPRREHGKVQADKERRGHYLWSRNTR